MEADVTGHSNELPTVGLGGSAGSISALQTFFKAMPADSGMAFVVILHLSPEHESTLAEVLQHSTSMPVRQVNETEKVEANHVYVIPPAKALTSMDGQLRLSRLQTEQGRRAAIDLFFRTLADTHGPRASAIVLSGADSDGALGVKRIKERGGLTIAQDPDEALHREMPSAAIATGMVDWVLNVGKMPARLLEYRALEGKLKLPPEEPPAQVAPEGEQERALLEVLTMLRTRTGRDFSYYKRPTTLRRIARRMQVNGVVDLSAYLDFLRTHTGEAGALLQDMLISVTNFFRDSEAFAALEKQIPQLFRGKGPNDIVRVWVPACATGEEAYSIAMLLAEHARGQAAPPRVQVFGTDLDDDVIRIAREGVYPETIHADVSQERLANFFSREARGYRVRRELRDTVLFAVHDVLKDSPFSRLDLVSCRNLLIYLNAEAQQKLFETLHFALKSSGLLFLGESESIEADHGLFTAVDKKNRIFMQKPAPRVGYPLPAGATALARTLEERSRSEDHPHPLQVPAPSLGAGLTPVHGPRGEAHVLSWGDIHRRLMERLGPPSVLVNAEHEMLHLSENAGRYLQFAGGEPSSDLLRAVHPMLRLELRAALYRAAQTAEPAQVLEVPMELDNRAMLVDVHVAPAHEIAPDVFLVVFENVRPAPAEAAARRADGDATARQLEHEVERLRAHLRDTVQQYEGSTEELKASNEELQAMNEELRSATEELETSREELHSINEELSSVNQELKSKVDELAGSNSDLHNLMAATEIATVFLDRQMNILRYTPSAVPLFNLIPSDVGRPLSDLAGRIEYPEMMRDAQRASDQLEQSNREVRAGDRWFLARVLPYRTADDRIGGVVFTFLDITSRRLAESALRESEERMRLIIENALDYAIFSTDVNRNITSWNPGAQRLLGYTEAEILHRSADLIYSPEDLEAGVAEQEARDALLHGRAADERWHVRKDRSRFFGSGALMAMHGPRGEPIGLVKIFRDETAARNAADALEQSRAELWQALEANKRARTELEVASRAKDQFLAVLSHELRTPLTPVAVAVQALELRSDLPPPVRKALEVIRRNVRVEAHFIDDLLDLTRISRGQLQVLREPIDVHDAIRGALEICEADIESKSQTLTLALDAEKHQLSGDARRLQQVVWNVLKNASKFTPPGGSIRVASASEDSRFRLTVTDSGIGIPADRLTAVFDAFTQGNERIARDYGGLGLGLAISKAAVEAHGGSMSAESAGPDRGTTVSITLPLE